MDIKTLQLHVTALNALSMCVLAALAQRDPALVREVIYDEAFTDFAGQPEAAGHSPAEIKAMQDAIDTVLRPLRQAIGEVPHA